MWTLLIILLVAACGTVSKCQLCEFQKSVELINHTYAGLTFGSNESFVDSKSKKERGCVCLKGTCARKCCPFGQGYNLAETKCVNITNKFDPPVMEQINTEFIYKPGFNATKEFILMIGKMACVRDAGEIRLPVYPTSQNFNLMTNGQLYVKVPELFIYTPDKYCIDTFVSKNEEPHLNALVCHVTKLQDKFQYILRSSCMLISCFFILLTVAVYALLPELRNLPGMVLMAYLLCFFVGFLFLAIMQILTLTLGITQKQCTILTFIIYFFLLAAFFWLNVMCYDIWTAFSILSTNGCLVSQHKRFKSYAIYAFGVPSVLTIILGALEFSNLPNTIALLPKVRLQGCFLYGKSKILYLYGPIGILCVANMTFFGLTAFKIWKTKNETVILRGKENCTHNQNKKNTQRFSLYVKLFIVMGISWILEVVSSFYPEADSFWQFSDAYNLLIGLLVFVIFVCKKKIHRMIQNRFCYVRRDIAESIDQWCLRRIKFNVFILKWC